MNIQQFSNCDDSVWISNCHKVITENFVPIEIRIEIFREVYNLIIEMGLRVWITNGTLLGAIRDGAFIELDDDIDMDMLEPDFIEVMYILKEKLMDLGYVVRLVDGKNPKMSFYKEGYKTSIGALKIQGSWLTRPIQKYPKKLFDNDLLINFYGIKCLAPNPPEPFLEHVYGSSWKIPYKGGRSIVLIKGIDWGPNNSLKFLHYRSLAAYYTASKIILNRIVNYMS